MKIRTGFVSNSSSSSFILRGTKLKSDDIIRILNISREDMTDIDDNNEYEIYEFLEEKLAGFTVHVDGNYFGNQDFSTLIVGERLGRLNDGDVVELKEYTPEENQKLIEKFEAIGFKDVKLKTYVQMVSNDNY
jgi:hypothetical protein